MTPRRRSRRGPALPARLPTIITFRVDEATAQALVQRATRLRVSPHDIARELVAQVLQLPHDLEELKRAVLVLHETLNHLRTDVASTAEVLLVTAGKRSAEEAYRWVEQTLVRPCSPSPTH